MHGSTDLNGPTTGISVHIGCWLGYIAADASPIVFLLRPHAENRGVIVRERFVASAETHQTRHRDGYGNRLIQTMLQSGYNEFLYEATLTVPDRPDNDGLSATVTPREQLPPDVKRYMRPSRYCESDRLAGFARQLFGFLPRGRDQVGAICDWVHANIEYRYGSGSCLLSACDILKRGYGVCRDFAHVVIALCRALGLPARYVAGHIPRLAANSHDDDIGRDFHAYVEVYLGRHWHTYDARHNRPLIGRIKIAHGMDAVDAAITTFYGEVEVTLFKAWSHPVTTTSAELENHQRVAFASQKPFKAEYPIKPPARSKPKAPNDRVDDDQKGAHAPCLQISDVRFADRCIDDKYGPDHSPK
jgi:transglutaminase-like putative cysteine protease